MSLQRIDTPAPWGEPPRQQNLDALFARAAFGRILARAREPGRRAARTLCWVHRAALEELGALLRIREGAPLVQCACGEAPALELFGAGAPMATLELHHAVALRWSVWSSDAELLDGALLQRWLAKRGAPELLATSGGAEEAALGFWRTTAPPALAPLREMLGEPFGVRGSIEAMAALERAHPSPADRARLLLEWLGRDTRPWTGAPPPLSMLALLGDEAVFDAIGAGLPSGPARLGAARFIVATVTTRAHQKHLWPRLRPLRDELRGAVQATGIAPNLRSLEAALDIAPPAAPAGTRLLAIAQRGRLSRVCRDGDRIFAVDGDRIARFAPGALEGEALFHLPGVHTPLFAVAGKVLFCFNGAIQAIPTAGGPPLPERPGLWSHLSSAPLRYSVARARWERARRRAAERLLAQGVAPVFLEVDDEEEKAYEILRLAGAPWPRAIACEHLAWFEAEGAEVHWVEGPRSGTKALGARVLHLAASDTGVVALLERALAEHALAWISPGGDGLVSASFAVPGAIVHLLPAAAGVCLVVEAPLGDLLLDVPLPTTRAAGLPRAPAGEDGSAS